MLIVKNIKNIKRLQIEFLLYKFFSEANVKCEYVLIILFIKRVIVKNSHDNVTFGKIFKQ